MPTATEYSEPQLARYMLTVLEQVGVTLGWDVNDLVVQTAVSDTLLDYGELDISAITGATGIRKLRTLSRRTIWRAVVYATSDYYSILDNGQKFERQQVNAQARQSLQQAEQECMAAGYDDGYAISIHAVSRPHDPYAVLPDEDRITP